MYLSKASLKNLKNCMGVLPIFTGSEAPPGTFDGSKLCTTLMAVRTNLSLRIERKLEGHKVSTRPDKI